MRNRAAEGWARRVAALRVFHIGAILLSVLSVPSLVGLLILIPPSGFQGIAIGAAAAGGALIVAFAATWFRTWRLRRLCESGKIGSAIEATRFPWLDLDNEAARIADFLGEPGVPLKFWRVSGRAPLAQIAKSRSALHIVFSDQGLLPTNAGAARGALWHEMSHNAQWDSTLGLWSLGLNHVMGILSLLASVYATFAFVQVWFSLKAMARLPDLKPQEMAFIPVAWAAEYRLIVGIAMIYCIYGGARFWGHLCEYNCDRLAALAGYAPDLVVELESETSPTTAWEWVIHVARTLWEWLKSAIGLHPRRSSRIASLKGLLDDPGSLAMPDGLLKITNRDWALGAMWVVAISGAFLLATACWVAWMAPVARQIEEFNRTAPPLGP